MTKILGQNHKMSPPMNELQLCFGIVNCKCLERIASMCRFWGSAKVDQEQSLHEISRDFSILKLLSH